MALDIGHILFIDILKMAQYPGSPFSGNIIYDIVMFFFVPSIFIILFIWTLTTRLLSGAPSKLFLLMGIGLYVFIIFNGMYAMFAYLVGPYFYFLIIIYGLFYYFIGHFGVVQNPSELVEVPAGRSMPAHAVKDVVRRAILLNKEIVASQEALKKIEKMHDPEGRGMPAKAGIMAELGTKEAELNMLEADIRFNPSAWSEYQKQRFKHRR